MDNRYKTKAQLVGETEAMRRRIAELEASETKHKRVEKALRELEECYQTLFEKAANPILVIDVEGNYVDANEAALRFLECTRAELLTKNVTDTIPPGRDLEELMREHKPLWQSGGRIETEYSVNGRIKILDLTIVPGWWQGKMVVFGMGIDITERKQGEEIKRTVMNATPDAVAVIDKKGILLDINESMARRFGKQPEELIGSYGWDLLPPALAKSRKEHFDRVFQTGQSLHFEDENLGTFFDNIVYPLSTEQGEVTKVAVIARDITEHRQAEEALQESEEKYRNLVKRANDGICIIQDRLVKYANPQQAEMWGGTVKELINTPFINYVHPDVLPVIALYYERRMAGEQVPSVYETALRRKDGSKAYAELNVGIINYLGKPAELVITRDITERKRMEDALRESEEKYRSLVQNSKDAVVLVDKSGNIQFANKAAEELTGYSLEMDSGRNVRDIIPKKHWLKCFSALRKVMNGESIPYFEIALKRKDGNLIQVETGGRAVFKDGKAVGVQIIARDITERKRSEAALQESERRYKELAGSITDIFFAFDKNLRYTYWNKASEELTGILAKDALGKHLYDIFPDSEMTRKAEKAYLKTLRTKQPQHFINEFRLKDKDFYFEISAYPSKEGLSVFAKDITERKRAEEALRESEERFRITAEETGQLLYFFDPKTGKVKWSGAIEAVTGYSHEEYQSFDVDVWAAQIHPDDRDRVLKAMDEALEHHTKFNAEYQFRRKDGSYIFVEEHGAHSSAQVSTPYSAIGTIKDITERKRTEEALQNSEERYRSLVNNVKLGLLRSTPGPPGRILEVNPAFEEITGYSRDEMLAMDMEDLYVHLEERQALVKELASAKETVTRELHWRRKDGSEIMVLNTVITLRDETGKVMHFDAIIEDITERKRMEEKYQAIIRTTIEGFCIISIDGKLLEANDSYCKMVGYSREELLNMSVSDIEAIENPEDIAQHLKSIAKDGFVRFETRHKRKDGELIDVEVSANYLDTVGGGQIFVFLRDITERKRAEAALRESEERYRTVFENTGTAIVIVEQDSMISLVNEECSRLFGYSKEEVEGKKRWTEFVAKEDLERIQEYHQLRRKNPASAPRSYEFRAIDRKGSVKDILITITMIPGTAKSVASLLDITERKRAAEKHQAIIKTTVDGFWINNLEGRFLEVNDSYCEMIGYTREELLEMSIPDIEAVETPQKTARHIKRIVEQGHDRFETRHRCRDGTIIDVEVSVNHLDVGEGQMFVFIRDVTERRRAEEALEESEERYRSLIHNVQLGILRITPGPPGKILAVNPAAEKITGYYRDELLAMDIEELYVRLKERQALVKELATTKGGIAREIHWRKKDGSEIVVLAKVIAIKDAAGKVLHHDAIIEDITERKRLEEDLREEQQELKLIIDSSPIIVFYKDKEGRFVRVNRAHAEGLEMSVEEIVGKTVFDLHSAKIAQNMTNDDQEVLKLGRPKFNIIEQYDSASSIRWVQTDKVPILDKGGVPVGLIGFAQDITERKKAEEALRESEEKLQRIFESVVDGIIVTDLNGAITEVNDAVLQLSGVVSKDDLIGKSSFESIAPRDRERALADMQELARHEIAGRGEYTLVRADGSEYPAEISADVLKDAAGNLIGFVSVIRDVTESKQVEEERRSIEQKAYIASRLTSIGEMASGIAHEINNPLTAILGYSQSLLRKDIPEDTKRKLEIIRDGTERIADIVGRLLAFSRQRKPQRSYVNLNELVESTLALQTYELQTDNIKVATQLTPELPSTMADAGQIQQVFLNIIINAQNEMKLAHGGGWLIIKSEVVSGTIRISFKDNGPGIAKENLERVFEPFFTTRAVGEGTGLGLSLCHGIILEHKGRIYTKSKLGKGATFIVELPVVAEGALPKPSKSRSKAKRRTRARILVVDDEPEIRQLLSEELTDEGHHIDTAENAGEALYKLQGDNYDLILLDVKLRGMSGIKLYQFMEKMPQHLTKRVVFITGDITGPGTQKFFSENKATYITKPFNMAQLKKDVNRMLSQRS